jgi:hypothetical protein
VAALAAAPAALACSCPAGLSVEERLASADAAFVGRLVAVRGTGYEFEIDRGVKGELPDERIVVRSGRDVAQCGLRRSSADDAVGILLTRAGSGWASSLCAQTTAGELLSIESPQRGARVKLFVGLVVLALVLGYSAHRLRRRERQLPG